MLMRVGVSVPVFWLRLRAGPYEICSQAGLASAVPPNVDLKTYYTYKESIEICQSFGLHPRNGVDPWTKSCSDKLVSSLKTTFGVNVWGINDAVKQGQRYPKRGVVCTKLNYWQP